MTGSRPRLLIVNPNTNVQVTGWLREEAARVAADDFDVIGVNAASGLAAIQTPDDSRKAGQAVADAVMARRCCTEFKKRASAHAQDQLRDTGANGLPEIAHTIEI